MFAFCQNSPLPKGSIGTNPRHGRYVLAVPTGRVEALNATTRRKTPDGNKGLLVRQADGDDVSLILQWILPHPLRKAGDRLRVKACHSVEYNALLAVAG